MAALTVTVLIRFVSPGYMLLADTASLMYRGYHGESTEEFERSGVRLESVTTMFLAYLHDGHMDWSLTADGAACEPTTTTETRVPANWALRRPDLFHTYPHLLSAWRLWSSGRIWG